MKLPSLAGLAAVSTMVVACGGAPLVGGGTSPFGEWNDDQGASAAALWSRLKGAPVVRSADVAVGVANGKLIGVPLDGSAKWTTSYALDARPVLTGSLVVATGGGNIVAFDAKSGQKVWTAASPGSLRGAGDDGALTAVVLGHGKGSLLVVVSRDGRVVSRTETDVSLGTPAMLSGVVFVPWGSQYVSAIDAKSGSELARILVREKTSHAWTAGGHLYFGEVGIFRFDDKTRFASQNRASHVTVPPRELAGSPTLFSAPETKFPIIAGARDRIRLYARAADREGALTLDSGRYFATYYRLVMGLRAERGQLTWALARPADVIGGVAGSGVMAVCDASGKIAVIDAQTGGVARELDAGEALQSCVVGMDELRVPHAAAPPLAQQLADVLGKKDAELATAHRLLLRELATLEDEVATKALIDLVSDSKTPVPVAADARTSLAGRRNGGRFMIEALGRHYDFLSDVLIPPPSGPIAQALGRMKEPGAAQVLVLHLLDPATPDADLRHIAAALATVARPDDAKELRQFFAMYHGTAQGDDQELAVTSVAQALLRVGGKDGKATVDAALARGSMAETLKARIQSVLEANTHPKDGAGDASKDAATSKPVAKPDPKPDAKKKPPAK